MGAVRWTYNQTVTHLNSPETKGRQSIKEVRALCVNNEATRTAWAKNVPYDVRDEGARDAKKAVGSNMAKQRIRKKQGLSHCFKLRYRRKKFSAQETLVVHSKHWSHPRGLYYDLLGKSGSKLKSAETLPVKLEYDIRLMRTRLNEYYLCIPLGTSSRIDNQEPDPTAPCVIALDPGVRTFMTGYDASGRVIEWAVGDTTRIHRLSKEIDSLHKRWGDVAHARRYKMKRAALRIRQELRNLVDEVHRKLSKWLCESYRVVLIPLFETQQMVKKGHRRLNSKTARAMCTWSHFRFRQTLMSKAKMYPHTLIVETTEEFTSKTCGGCGVLNNKLGGKKIFTCGSCGFRSDRDFNGARNILIRHLTVTGASP